MTQLGDPTEGIVIRAIYHDDNDTDSVEQVAQNEEPIKIIRDGQVYIRRGENIYTLTGQEVK